MNGTRKLYLDFLRVISAIAVVSIHTKNMTGFSVGQGAVISLFAVCMQWAVPVFIMISGSLFLDKEKEISINSIYKKSIFKTIVLYVFWSSLYAFIMSIKYSRGDVIQFFKTFISDTISGHYHLWYLLMLLGLYIATPIIRACLAKDDVLLKYWLGICFIAIPLFKTVQLVPIFDSLFSKGFDTVNVGFATKYVMYYLLGYYLSKAELSKRVRHTIYILAVISFVFTSAGTVLFSLRDGKLNTFLSDSALPNQIIISTALFIFSKSFFTKHTFSVKAEKALTWVSSCTLGIYLLHPLLCECIFNKQPSDFALALFVIPLKIILIFCISLAVTSLLKFVAKKIKIIGFIV